MLDKAAKTHFALTHEMVLNLGTIENEMIDWEDHLESRQWVKRIVHDDKTKSCELTRKVAIRIQDPGFKDVSLEYTKGNLLPDGAVLSLVIKNVMKRERENDSRN